MRWQNCPSEPFFNRVLNDSSCSFKELIIPTAQLQKHTGQKDKSSQKTIPSTPEERIVTVFSFDYFSCRFILNEKKERGQMIWMKSFTCLAYVLSIIIVSPNLFASECTSNTNFIDRGETKIFIICGKDIPRNFALKGLSEAKITVEYEQHLQMCAIGKDF
jgi:hypothetical protein